MRRTLITDSNTHNSMLRGFDSALPATSLVQLSSALLSSAPNVAGCVSHSCSARLGSAQLSSARDFIRDHLSDDYLTVLHSCGPTEQTILVGNHAHDLKKKERMNPVNSLCFWHDLWIDWRVCWSRDKHCQEAISWHTPEDAFFF